MMIVYKAQWSGVTHGPRRDGAGKTFVLVVNLVFCMRNQLNQVSRTRDWCIAKQSGSAAVTSRLMGGDGAQVLQVLA